MPDVVRQRYAGVEDESRIKTADGQFVSVDKLILRSPRFFFDESGHVPVFEPVYDYDSTGGRVWTWYGGTIYHDYDSAGTLVEAATPLTPLTSGVDALVDNVLTQRAQLVELSRSDNAVGISTHLNLLLDSYFRGTNLCDFKALVPSNAFGRMESQKLGSDIALLATHTISPVIAYLLFNHRPSKGALYRPRRNGRMELCLPYQGEPDQMRAGFLFWFAAVDHITNMIKAELDAHEDWVEHYQDRDYYRALLPLFPYVISDVSYRRPSYYLGYQVANGVEENVMENGSAAVIKTQRGDVNVVDLAKEYVRFFSADLTQMGSKQQLTLLDSFLDGTRKVNVDVNEVPKSMRLDQAYVSCATGKLATQFLNSHEVDELASIHLKFVRNPVKVIKTPSSVSPERVVRTLGGKLLWDFVNLEIVEETESSVRQYRLEVPLFRADEYLTLEANFNRFSSFLEGVSPWLKSTVEAPNPRNIFAYGTLMDPEKDRRGFGANVTAVRKARTYGEAYDFGDYAVLIENSNTSLVPGVLLSIENFEEAVNKIDFYEGCHNPNPIFVRALRQVMLDNLETITAWVYVGNRNNRMVREKLRTAPRVTGLWARGAPARPR